MSDSAEPIKPSSPEPALTPEQITKSDLDIRTLAVIRDLIKSRGFNFMVVDGYAVEAHCGGKITRPHDDMDAYVFIPNGSNTTPLQGDIRDILSQEPTNWQTHAISEDGRSIEFREDASDKTWAQRRRLEISFFGPEFPNRTQTRTLIDSLGRAYEFEVQHIADLTASKIRKLVTMSQMSEDERARKGFRATRESDKNEVIRLINCPGFSKQECVESMKGYESAGQLTSDEALRQAEAQWDLVMNLLK